MKRCLLCLPLLALAPLGHFLGFYLAGPGVLPFNISFLVSAMSMFILPWAVSAIFAAVPKTPWVIRITLFICAMLVQGLLFVKVAPAGAASEMMGIAHRLRGAFPPNQLHDCAEHLRQKRRDGTLALGDKDSDRYFPMSESAVVVPDSELPVSLRGRFQRVFIQRDHDTGDEQVWFALDGRSGIVCDSRKQVHDFFLWSMADGVHAYRYQRL